MSEERWIDQQRQNRMFRHGGKGNDADRMLEKSEQNRILSPKQAKLLIVTRNAASCMELACLSELCDLVENAQLCVDAESRHNFMKVAIEQWQGKLANLRHKASLELLQ